MRELEDSVRDVAETVEVTSKTLREWAKQIRGYPEISACGATSESDL